MANPPADQSTITQNPTIYRDGNGDGAPLTGNYKNITSQATTLVKTGAGFLYSVTFNKPTATAVVEIDDAITNTTPIIAKVTVPASPQPFTLHYNVAFTVGLSITTTVADQDITVNYR